MKFIFVLVVITNTDKADHQVMVGAYETAKVCEARAKEYNTRPDWASCLKVTVRP